jgi:hypothetical protein
MRIRRGVSSRFLPCGCVAGVYETYNGEIVAIIDARGAACAEPTHVDGNRVPEDATLVRNISSHQSTA